MSPTLVSTGECTYETLVESHSLAEAELKSRHIGLDPTSCPSLLPSLPWVFVAGLSARPR